MIDLAKIAQLEAARAAFPFGAHELDCHRMCRCCLDRTEARYEFTRVVEADGGALCAARSFTCGSCGSTYTAALEPLPTGSTLVVDAITDRREWAGREKSGVHRVSSLSVPEDAGRYSLPGDLVDDAPVRISRWA